MIFSKSLIAKMRRRDQSWSPEELSSQLYSKAAVFITALFFFVAGLAAPVRNWDMVAYVASAYEQDGLSGKQLSSATYKAIEKEAAENIGYYTSGKFAGTVYQDPESLKQQLPFYNIRIVYVTAVHLLGKIGIAYPKATYLISAFFAAASIVTLAAVFAQFGLALFWLPIVAVFSGYLSLARLSTPDAMACCFSLLTVYLFITRNRLIYIAVLILPLVRTDLVILSVLLMFFDFILRKSYFAIAAGLASLLMYYCLALLMGGYGYLTLFNHTFIQLTPYPGQIVLSRQPSDYVKPYYEGMRDLVWHRHSLLYVLAVFFAFKTEWYKKAKLAFVALMVIPGLYAFLHMALFPHYEARFFAFPASLVFAALLTMLTQTKFQPSEIAPAQGSNRAH